MILLREGALTAVPDRAMEYVSEQTWARMTRRWRGRNCTALAYVAREILDGRTLLHGGIGRLVAHMVGIFEANQLARQFAYEISSRVPLPIVDEQLTVAARGLQLTGILFCWTQQRELAECACLVDLVKVEGKGQLRSLLLAAEGDWVQLRTVPAVVADDLS
ncbi:hypothetical protein JQS43_10575 [Natronosporangium hydrolyticum]|uniref:Uncharacterized protein n=1 Tax=Natronosporangium hydrolyticum TaxID=2811111 RepID=A0A895YMI1_9ACTN|nr:hypothetical protein [Natronosporangium hydrolyticum]QSB16679.1 hypothetical protein JQS43_10575 [Natronosporangium hydrolyticum]